MKRSKKTLVWLCAIIIVFSLMGCNILSPSGYAVQKISDGDTLQLQDNKNQTIKVRFACVDAPEVPHSTKERQSKTLRDRNQFQWGEKAQKRLEQLIQQGGNRVEITQTDKDRYGRIVAEIRLRDGTFVQEVLVQEGLALVYRPYLNKCPSKDIIQQAETQAKQKKRGVWRDDKFVSPWEYRSFK
ncbi:MAG: thermonuclease family protein [Sphaerospermopsis sp.]|nr:thermonuclease family protein [Sphaerospermopsis sp.]